MKRNYQAVLFAKLSHLNYHIEGNQLQEAIRATARVKERLLSKDLKTKK